MKVDHSNEEEKDSFIFVSLILKTKRDRGSCGSIDIDMREETEETDMSPLGRGVRTGVGR